MTFQARLKLLILVFILILCFWFIGFLYFAFHTGKENCTTNQVDAIIVLTGGENRIEEAIKLFYITHAKKILISGVGKGVVKNDFATMVKKHNVANSDIVLGNLAQDTFGNAMEAEIFMKLQGYNSMCLVTSSYHLPRSLKIFKDIMPGIKIAYYPVSHSLDSKSSLISKLKSLRKVFYEYNKYLASYVIFYLDALDAAYYKFLYRYLP